MKNFLTLLVIASCATGCNQKKDTSNTPVAIIPPQPAPGCYRMIIEKDTALMQLGKHGDSLYGTLEYRRFAKDDNKGTVVLLRTGDKAVGWYNFLSEGMSSVRQIKFKITDSSFAEAYGDIEMRGDTAVYKFPATVNFEEKHPFVKIPCY